MKPDSQSLGRRDLRIGFNSNLQINDLTLVVDDCRFFNREHLTTLRHTFNRFGFVVLRSKNATNLEEQLLSVGSLFGQVVSHPRSDFDGIATIAVSDSLSEYLGTSNIEHLPHTDGTYDDHPPLVM